ncbi:rubrerythrin [Gehongia tenuis]|uniref:Rubrerythrin family protein n=1 Tax=Gehongia tenuis TaxID=2763655 RepID=A0A926D5W5_9FIRM|nr:rubrerythrin family protein [Gehongia tenuis]MBC8532012.1 rubrerythrin family protein [Gehongia tenuis]
MSYLDGSQTAVNLLRAFAGECQARGRYSIYAVYANREGKKVARDLFLEIADNEKEHAQRYYELLIHGLGDVAQNINIDAGYPVALGKTQDNLNYSYDAEWEEHTEIYPGFAQIAANEGFMDVSEAFARIAEAENTHAQRFHAMWEEMSQGLDLSRPTPVQWICTNCGYIHVGTQPPAVCPACLHAKGYFKVRGAIG